MSIIIKTPVEAGRSSKWHPFQVPSEEIGNRPMVVTLSGSVGCGKTELIAATAARLAGDLKLGIVLTNAQSSRDVQQLGQLCPSIASVTPDDLQLMDAKQLLDSLGGDQIDLVLVEAVAVDGIESAKATEFSGVGSSRVSLFSVSGGHDTPARYPSRLRHADLVLLTKTDLIGHVTFDLWEFRYNVARLSAARLIELAPRRDIGMDGWCRWLRNGVNELRGETNNNANSDVLHRSVEMCGEWFLG